MSESAVLIPIRSRSHQPLCERQTVTLDVHASAARESVLSHWRRLEDSLRPCPLMCSADWTETWLNAFGDLVPHRFVLGYVGEELCGICLVTEGVQQTDGPFRVKSLHIGTAGEPDADTLCVECNRILVRPEHELQFTVQLVNELNRQTTFDQWNLDGLRQCDAKVFSQCEPHLEFEVVPSYFMDLDAVRTSGTELFQVYRNSVRKQIRRSMEILGQPAIEWAEDISLARSILAELKAFHQARWNAIGKPGVYSSRRFNSFHEELLERLVPTGRMALIRVKSPTGTIGCTQLLFDRNRALVYQCGWSQSADRASPGVLVDYLAMQECLNRGYAAYDFLAHETQHKRHLSNDCEPMVWARRRRWRWKFFLLEQGRRLKRWMQGRGSPPPSD